MYPNTVACSFVYKSEVTYHLSFELPSGDLLNNPEIIGVVTIIPGMHALVREYKVPYEVVECEVCAGALKLAAQLLGIHDGALRADHKRVFSTKFIIMSE